MTCTILVIVICGLVHSADTRDGCEGRTTERDIKEDSTTMTITVPDFNFCWKIYAPDGYRVRLRFKHFNLTTGYDFLEVGDLWDKTIRPGSTLATFGSSDLPNDVISFGKGIWIRLKLALEITKHFPPTVEFEVLAAEKPSVIKTSCCGYPSALTFPEHSGNYSNNEYRMWIFETRRGCTISMSVKKLWVEENHDFIFIGDRYNDLFERRYWRNITGKRTIAKTLLRLDYTSPKNILVVIFTSDFSKRKPGFTLELVAKGGDAMCEANEDTSTRSPLASRSGTTDVPSTGKRNGEAIFYTIVMMSYFFSS